MSLLCVYALSVWRSSCEFGCVGECVNEPFVCVCCVSVDLMAIFEFDFGEK